MCSTQRTSAGGAVLFAALGPVLLLGIAVRLFQDAENAAVAAPAIVAPRGVLPRAPSRFCWAGAGDAARLRVVVETEDGDRVLDRLVPREALPRLWLDAAERAALAAPRTYFSRTLLLGDDGRLLASTPVCTFQVLPPADASQEGGRNSSSGMSSSTR